MSFSQKINTVIFLALVSVILMMDHLISVPANLEVISRCEVGELVNNINSFRVTTKDILSDMTDSAKSSSETAGT